MEIEDNYISDIRLPLDLLLVSDAETLEEGMYCKYAVEHEAEIYFARNDICLQDLKEEYGDDIRYYKIDSIEIDRINAVIELLCLADEDVKLGHLIDRIVR